MLTKKDKYQILLLKLKQIFDSLISGSQGRNITTFKTSFAHETKQHANLLEEAKSPVNTEV